jgi:hypothetical protein
MHLIRREAPPVTPESVAAAFQDCVTQRAELGYQPPTDEEWERLEATNGLYALMQRYGAKRVLRWVQSLAAIHGMECE